MADQMKRRWCAACAKPHGGVSVQKKCEDCKQTRPSWGMPDERKTRWCAGCGKKVDGAIFLRTGGITAAAAAAAAPADTARMMNTAAPKAFDPKRGSLKVGEDDDAGNPILDKAGLLAAQERRRIATKNRARAAAAVPPAVPRVRSAARSLVSAARLERGKRRPSLETLLASPTWPTSTPLQARPGRSDASQHANQDRCCRRLQEMPRPGRQQQQIQMALGSSRRRSSRRSSRSRLNSIAVSARESEGRQVDERVGPMTGHVMSGLSKETSSFHTRDQQQKLLITL